MTWAIWDTRAEALVCPHRLLRWHAELIADLLDLAWGEAGRFQPTRAKRIDS